MERPDDLLEVLRDPDRLRALYEAELLDSSSEEAFDRLTRLARNFLDVPVAMVNLVTGESQFVKSCVGGAGQLEAGRQVPLSHSFCKHAVARAEPLIVGDARRHRLVRDNPAIEEADIAAYLGAPLVTSEGFALGSLCVIDREPREWSEAEVRAVEDLAEAATTEIELRTDVRRRRALERELEQRVRQRTADLQAAQDEILRRLAAAAEYRDDETGKHTRRVGTLSGALAELLGRDPEWRGMLRRAAPLHDIGKVGIADSILLKEGPLTDEEYEVMKRHTVIGGDLLEGGRSELVQLAESVARTHHERWDGGGYPNGLEAEEIPLAGRIVAVADAFDAMVHDRPYRPALKVSEALSEVRRQRGRQFAPGVADALLENAEVLLAQLEPDRSEGEQAA